MLAFANIALGLIDTNHHLLRKTLYVFLEMLLALSIQFGDQKFYVPYTFLLAET
jgi:hypothetical protein